METNTTIQQVTQLFESWAGEKAIQVTPLPASASYRVYYRIQGETQKAIAAYNADKKENNAFIQFTQHFLQQGIAVPNLYAQNLAANIYLLEDLGDQTLLNTVLQSRAKTDEPNSFGKELVHLYEQTILELVKLQINGHQNLDYQHAYPRAAFDRQSIMWDLNYFKYYFLKLAKIPFDEQLLEEDFAVFADYLLQANNHFFLHRDCQGRNVMLKDGKPYFIDYQGGRQGALQYDLAALLYQAKANIPNATRRELLHFYIDAAAKLTPIDVPQFMKMYDAYVLVRSIQVLGAYGFRGFYERKKHFLDSIPFALNNVAWLLANADLPDNIPTLKKVLQELVNAEELKKFGNYKAHNSPLVVTVSSFSYKNQIPPDTSGNGGGFVFDCRAIHNPGRYAPYKKLTGRDESVIHFLKTESNIEEFLRSAFALVDNSVATYIERNFTSLMVSFGCTGGQHRSVYSADKLAEYLESKYGVQVNLTHIEQERKGWVN